MLAKDIREMSEADINARIAELERERFNLRLASGTRTLDDPLRLRVIRKDVARLQTVLREKAIGIAEAESGKREEAGGKRVTARRVTGRRGRKSATAINRAKRSKRA
jgi:large subunit ribosomal protein L29